MALRIELDHASHVWRSTGNGVDLSVPVNPHSGLPRAWYRGPATAEACSIGRWVGSVAEGGSVNFRDVTFNPHAHGTHTETREHVRDDFHPIDALARSGTLPFLVPSLLIDAQPRAPPGDDWVVPLSALARHAAWMRTMGPGA